jgi:hypothetical protein
MPALDNTGIAPTKLQTHDRHFLHLTVLRRASAAEPPSLRKSVTTQSYNSLPIAQETSALALPRRGAQESKSTHTKV